MARKKCKYCGEMFHPAKETLHLKRCRGYRRVLKKKILEATLNKARQDKSSRLEHKDAVQLIEFAKSLNISEPEQYEYHQLLKVVENVRKEAEMLQLINVAKDLGIEEPEKKSVEELKMLIAKQEELLDTDDVDLEIDDISVVSDENDEAAKSENEKES